MCQRVSGVQLKCVTLGVDSRIGHGIYARAAEVARLDPYARGHSCD